MTVRLILMRHARSSWDKPVSDHDRKLNNRGRASAAAMGNWLRENNYAPEEALISTAKRTRETFLGLKIEPKRTKFLSTLYHSSVRELMSALKSSTEKTVLIVSHNLTCADFAEMMAEIPPKHERFRDFPTCATWVAEMDIQQWCEVEFKIARTIAFAVPREVISSEIALPG